jgi:hypothetical protein
MDNDLKIDAWPEDRHGRNVSRSQTIHHYASAVWTEDGLETLWESTEPYKTREAALKAAKAQAAVLAQRLAKAAALAERLVAQAA